MALAAQLLKSGRGVNGSAFFTEGMSSDVDPMFVSDRAVRYAENCLHRGGVFRTRPGYRSCFSLPEGKYQGSTYFRPLSSDGQLVFAVAGKLYRSVYPFSSYTEIPDIQLYEHADRVYFCSTTKSAQKNADGTVQSTEPKRTLVAQDGGYTRAAYWDGATGGHSDPTQTTDGSGNVLSAGIPLGGPMAWSGDRLWVAQGPRVYASDISDPLSFTENEYAAEGGFFMFEEDVVALAEIPSLESPVLLIFSKTRTSALQSGVRARSTWKETKNFQSTVVPGIGCVSHRAVVSFNGLLWWMTPVGLTNLNAAQQSKLTSLIEPQDAPMAASKANLHADLSGTALGAHENFLLVSVPNGDKWNRHTWVYDQTVVGKTASWAGLWTGTRPVDWVSGLFAGQPKVLQVSYDYDRTFRLWEAFQPNALDGDSPVEAAVETKTHIDFSDKATGLDLKNFVFAEISFVDVLGNVSVSVYWAGTRGKYKLLGTYPLVATPGGFSASTAVAYTETVGTNRPQQRVIRTPEIVRDPNATCSSFEIESKYADWLDVGFSLYIKWTGQASLRSYRLFVDPQQEMGTGSPATAETGTKVLSGTVCSDT